jgi:hypothetical protein
MTDDLDLPDLEDAFADVEDDFELRHIDALETVVYGAYAAAHEQAGEPADDWPAWLAAKAAHQLLVNWVRDRLQRARMIPGPEEQ